MNNNKTSKNMHWTLLPIKNSLRKRILRKNIVELKSYATKTWQIAEGATTVVPAAIYLPNQIEKITGCEFASALPIDQIEGGMSCQHTPTMAYLIKDVWLLDGSFYKHHAALNLMPRTKKIPQLFSSLEYEQASVYSTFAGIKYFGQWLLDDCVTYPLCSDFAPPVTPARKIGSHTQSYMERLNMTAIQCENAFFKELIIFDDVGQNKHKHTRFRNNTEKLLAGVDAKPHPGVFILRGKSGVARVLNNELEVAEHVRNNYGFRILDPMKESLDTIIATCAGAHVVMGVEGSQLIHGLVTQRENSVFFPIMPPDRFVILNKNITDRDNQHFAFVVGDADGDGFKVDLKELDQTLALLPKAEGL
jgi:glycosyl transferase family 61